MFSIDEGKFCFYSISFELWTHCEVLKDHIYNKLHGMFLRKNVTLQFDQVNLHIFISSYLSLGDRLV